MQDLQYLRGVSFPFPFSLSLLSGPHLHMDTLQSDFMILRSYILPSTIVDSKLRNTGTQQYGSEEKDASRMENKYIWF